MDVITFAFTALLSFAGLLIGAVLAHYTKDEVHDVKHSIPYMQLAVFVLLFVILFLYFDFWMIFIILILAMTFIYRFWSKNNLNKLDYIIFALLMVVSSLNADAHLYVTLTIFCFGIFSGILYYVMHTKPKDKKKHAKKIKHHYHSNKHLSLTDIAHNLFMEYYYFLVIAVGAFIVSKLAYLIL